MVTNSGTAWVRVLLWLNAYLVEELLHEFTAKPSYEDLAGTVWSSYSPDLTPSDFQLFLHLKSFLAGKHFNNDKELKENVSNWLKTQAATFYEEGIEKLVPRYDTCLQNFGSYVESVGRESTEDDQRPGRLVTVSGVETVTKINQIVRADRRMSIRMIVEAVNADKETVR
ncbi:histone-lysine N-methyltransferase SETMAR [Trichonephila clavipes]|nr:histone-lysine N-methyltransferase SETMAR [Trichonephila clavipes]